MTKKRRLSEILELCLTQVLSGRETIEAALAQYPEYADELRSELEAALWLHQRRSLTSARPGYIAASRQRLIADIQRDAAQPTGLKKLFPAWNATVFRLAFVTLFLFISVFSAQTGVKMVNASLPGDQLYSWKLASEDLRLNLAPDAVAEAELHIQFVDLRAQEVEALVAQERYEDAVVAMERYQQELQITCDLVVELPGAPVRQAELAQALADNIAGHNQVFSSFAATAAVPADLAALVADTIIMTADVTAAMVVVLDGLGQEWTPSPDLVLATVTPTATATLLPTQTEAPSNTPLPTDTAVPTNTAVPSDTPGPSATPIATETPEAETPSVTPTETPVPTQPEEDEDDGIIPTKKPTKTPKPKPTKKPKDK